MENAATLYRTDGTALPVAPKNDKTFTLEEMQFLVGGYVELCPFKTPDGQFILCDEEGKLKGKPLNQRATDLSGLFPHDALVGDVLVGPPSLFE